MLETRLTPGQTTQTMLLELADNIKPDRTAEDLLVQSLLRLGADLSVPIRTEEIDGREVYIAGEEGENFLVACFDKKNGVSTAVVEAIAKMKPQFAVFRDPGLKDDATLANFDQIFERLSPSTDRRII